MLVIHDATPRKVCDRGLPHRSNTRSPTLLLRYFEDLDSKRIAEMQGVPAATVRTRVKRGLERLRSRLDEKTDGGRRAWMAGLILLAKPPTASMAPQLASTKDSVSLPAVRWA